MIKRFLKSVLFGCGFMCLAVTSVLASGLIAQSAQANEAAPDFTLSGVNGGTVTLKASLGNGAVIFFFTTWCPHCQNKIPMLADEYAAIKKDGLALFVIDTGESEAKVKSYAQKHNVPFEVLLDPRMEAAQAYGVRGVPSFFLVNKDGLIVYEGHELPKNFRDLLAK